jgi:hypothetical protein
MKPLKELTESELIIEILKCDKEILKIMTFNGTQGIEVYPGALMGLGDFYCEKTILIDELLR